jgi:type I restriction enzyme S subunit
VSTKTGAIHSTAATGISRYALSVNDIGMTPLRLPSLQQQRRIASFLDEQTARIDALIAEKGALIGKLQEQQYSYASQLLARGLNPSVLLTPTSFPEIGAVPAHWDVKRLKFLGEVRSGIAKGKDLGDAKCVQLPYLRVANVQDGYVDLTEVLEIEVATSDVARYLLQKGDVLMNEGGDNDKLGRGTVWQGQIDPCVHQNHVFAVRLFDTSLAEWVAKFTSTDAARTYFYLRSKQSTNLASINQSNVRELPVPMPPAEERLAILAELNRFTSAAEQLRDHVRAHLERLREYRASLISAAVTGQLDIGAFQAKLPEAA